LPDVQIGGWGLPGHGQQKDTCGTFFMKGCLNLSEHPDGLAVFKPMVRRCFDPKCPEDWHFWALRGADRIAVQIEDFAKKNPWVGKPIHHVVSVPKKDWHLSKSELCKKAYHVAKRTGFLGGSVIYHPFRESDDSRWYFSPHFHLIGFGWIKDTDKEFKRSGWISHNERVRKSVFGTAFYQLTHCGVWYGSGKKCSITWFGCMAYSKFKREKSIRDQVFCPYCGEPMETLIYIGPGDMPLPCSGIGGVYLACSDGWESSKLSFFISQMPKDWSFRYKIPRDLSQEILIGTQ
jgi:hypothetical protein